MIGPLQVVSYAEITQVSLDESVLGCLTILELDICEYPLNKEEPVAASTSISYPSIKLFSEKATLVIWSSVGSLLICSKKKNDITNGP